MRRVILIAAVVVAVCAAGAIAYLTVWRAGDSDAAASPRPSATSSPTPSASPSPSDVTPTPTAAPSASQDAPSSAPTASATPSATPSAAPSSTPTPTPTPTTPARATADVELSYLAYDAGSGSVQASGYAAVYEEGGTCTLVLTKQGATARGQIEGLPDVSTTSCGGLEVPGSELSSGTWTAVLQYESPTTVGSSQAREVVVP